MISGRFSKLMPLAIFALAFVLVPWESFNGFQRMPGDIGDARLNNYFLENVYQFFSGGSPSLWHPPFFSPFPWVLGFSDNLFGSAPVYILARGLGAPSDTAFQLWFLFGYAANFAAAYWALRRIGGSEISASVGALIFAFALPTMSHMGHAQLHYRFGIPLALVFFAEFLAHQRARALLAAFGWLVWQLYAGVYMGFFALLMMALMVPVHLLMAINAPASSGLRAQFSALAADWADKSRRQRIMLMAGFVALLAALTLLFWPYLQVTEIYSVSRNWAEIDTMLPRPQSYILSDGSALWGFRDSTLFADLPMRHEHQMFAGLVPLLLALAGLVVAIRRGAAHVIWLLTGAMVLLIAITLQIGGNSLWYYLHNLPLASSIRAMTRFDQVILFPMAALAMVALDALRVRVGRGPMLMVSTAVLVLGLSEMMQYHPSTSTKAEWRDRLTTAEAVFAQEAPGDLLSDTVLFMAQRDGPFYADELDAMWIAAQHGVATMNGYSGNLPPGSKLTFGTDCSEIARRINGYLSLFHTGTSEQDYIDLVASVVPVGFPECDPEIFTGRRAATQLTAAYTSEEVRALSYTIASLDAANGRATVALNNAGQQRFAAGASPEGLALRLSWRYLNASGAPLSGWENRQDLPYDIPPKSTVEITLFLKIPKGAAMLEVSMLQEGAFWFHDDVIGIMPVAAHLW